MLIKKKACFPNFAQKLKSDFNLYNEDRKKAFLLPHSITFEPYVKAFQFKLLNSILFANSKMFKIGYRTDNLCSFCKQESETIKHFFHDCPTYSNLFWKNVELYYFVLRKQQVHLTLKDILIGILTSQSSLLNYLILIGKIYYFRRTEVLPHIDSFIVKVNIKYETEKYICTKNKSLKKLMDKWNLQFNLSFIISLE